MSASPSPVRDPRFAELDPTLSLLRPGDAGYSAYTSDVVLDGRPDAVLRPRTESEVIQVLESACRHRIPVTPAGGHTSLTGSSVALDGWLLDTQRFNKLLDIGRDPDTGHMVAIAEPGLFLGDLQREVEQQDWFYPPDPTSRNEACLGATVATNATGEDTLFYGPTRRWVRELTVIRADGTRRVLRRSALSHPREEKATAGYYMNGEEIDLLIGSEGTLGVITRVTVDLIPRPAGVSAGMAFFASRRAALEFVVQARQDPHLVPRALELIDRASWELLEGRTLGIVWPEEAEAAIVFKQEWESASDREARLLAWSALIERQAGSHSAVAEATLFFEGPVDLERLRAVRHLVPSTLNERLLPYREQGGAKVATDWWVPYSRLPVFLDRWDRATTEAGIPTFMFGHVGNGHPHVNFLCRNAAETERAQTMVLAMCQEAVQAGGGVAGEHGLGKLKRHLLAVQCDDETITRMRQVKRTWDPLGILGKGNVFPEEEGV
ncbi:MAG TPA: FAD-binding oxidoreductase [Candidatus Eisenbacteria bacterium]|nr:FAD-binding oxidoreductase [Candidatus Eisenbacteria bacterium]